METLVVTGAAGFVGRNIVPLLEPHYDLRKDEVGWCWLSPRDLATMVTACLNSDVGFGVYLVASRGAIGHWDLSNDVGWEPIDSPDRG